MSNDYLKLTPAERQMIESRREQGPHEPIQDMYNLSRVLFFIATAENPFIEIGYMELNPIRELIETNYLIATDGGI